MGGVQLAFENWQGASSRKMVWTHVGYFGSIGSYTFSTPYQGSIAPSVRIYKSRQVPSSRAVIDLTNFRRDLDGKIAEGDPVSWQWIYYTLPTATVEIFKGEVVNISKGLTLQVEARDELWPVLKDRRSQYFQEEKPEAILAWFCNRAGVEHDIYETDVELPRFVAKNLNASEVAEKLCEDLKRHDGTDTSDWAHFLDDDGQFIWGPYEPHIRPWQGAPPAVRVGEEVLEFKPPGTGYGRLTMLPRLTVGHSKLMDIIQADGATLRVRVEEITYRQESTRLRMDVMFQPWG